MLFMQRGCAKGTGMSGEPSGHRRASARDVHAFVVDALRVREQVIAAELHIVLPLLKVREEEVKRREPRRQWAGADRQLPRPDLLHVKLVGQEDADHLIL